MSLFLIIKKNNSSKSLVVYALILLKEPRDVPLPA